MQNTTFSPLAAAPPALGTTSMAEIDRNSSSNNNSNGIVGRKAVSEIARVSATGIDALEVDEPASSFGGLEPGTSTVAGSSFNFVNSIVGAGVIGIPYAIQQCGLVLGIIMILIVAYLVNRSVLMIIKCGIKARIYDYEQLAEHLLGPSGYFAVLAFCFMYAYGACIAYLVIIGDTLPLAFEFMAPRLALTQRNLTIALVSVLIILPLCLLKDLNSLSWTSLASIMSDLILLLLILIAAPEASSEQDEHFTAANLSDVNYTLFAGVGTMSFAFVCQHNSFLIFKSLKVQTYTNFKKVCNGSILTALGISLGIGLTGFLYFYPEVDGDILNNFSSGRASLCVARLFLALTMLFTFPMEVVVARHCLLSMLHRIRRDNEAAAAAAVLHTQGGGGGGGGSSSSMSMANSVHSRHAATMDISEIDYPLHHHLHQQQQQQQERMKNEVGLELSPVNASTSIGTDLPAAEEGFNASNTSAAASAADGVTSINGGMVDMPDNNGMDDSRGKFGNKYGKIRTDSGGGGGGSEVGDVDRNGNENWNGNGEKDAYEEQNDNSKGHKHSVELNGNNSAAAAAAAAAATVAPTVSRNTDALIGVEYAPPHTATCWQQMVQEYQETVNDPARLEWLGITLVLWGSALGIALVFTDLGVVSGLTGAVAASMIGYILPAVLFTVSHKGELNMAISRAFPQVDSADSTLYVDEGADGAQYRDEKSNSLTVYTAVRGCALRCVSLWHKMCLFGDFYLPLLMFIFGVVSMFIGIITIAYTNS